MAVTREIIEETLKKLNEAENNRPNTTVEETIAGIDAVSAVDVEGWKNGVHAPNREAERQGERVLFGIMADYHRDFEKVIIDPPYVAVTWKITGTWGDKPAELVGCSIMDALNPTTVT
ncbi:MAG: hypothetical protein ACTSQW_03070 [Promethearchaeota archaeon]